MGVLTGNESLKSELVSSERIEIVRRLEPIAAELSCSLAQLAIAWCLKSPHVSSVITCATRPAQVEENLRGRHAS